ncbi:MAG TPA: helix-turn-helix transcriptional regulator [Clostridia bacterium]|nr:helix-turn-helix transcriptional regulator [Clostridia bacterium]
MEGQGVLESKWETSGAKPRKYYALTQMGSQVYFSLKKNWLALVKSIELLMEGTDNG